jgi:esterase/lipase superfamily enzyme
MRPTAGSIDPEFHPRPVVAAIRSQAGVGQGGHRFGGARVEGIVIAHRASSGAAASRRAVLRGLASAASTLALAGCAGMAATAPGFDVSGLSSDPALLVATTRKPTKGAHAAPWYGTERSSSLNLARARLASPSKSRFSLAAVGLDDWSIEAVEPVATVGELVAATGDVRDILIYVHGFNQTFENAALDAVRLSDGIRFHGDSMVFSWPSRAKLFDYGYDRESAMWSRDALQKVLEGLMTSPNIGRIHIVAHSIGTMVTMEALRQLYATGGDAAAARIGAVVFASPDIDVDVFASSVERIGPLAQKITLIVASNDRALALSGWIAGGIARVGAAHKAQLARLGLRVIDASDQGWGMINHDLFLSNDRVRGVIRAAIDGRPEAVL